MKLHAHDILNAFAAMEHIRGMYTTPQFVRQQQAGN
eukprot:COSAG06_NODE_1606_length_8951_cov_7.831112_7_plen_36_part_00